MGDSRTSSRDYGLVRLAGISAVAALLLGTAELLAELTNISVSASPASVSAAGGTTTISATVSDADGKPAPNVSVGFSADNGSLSAEAAATDQNGTARVFLTTKTTTTVVATLGASAAAARAQGPSASVSINVAPLPTVSITPSTSRPSPNAPVTFTIRATPATDNRIVSVLIEYGDGRADSLSGNATSVPHVYATAGSYGVSVTATDSLGGSGRADTTVEVGLDASQAEPVNRSTSLRIWCRQSPSDRIRS